MSGPVPFRARALGDVPHGFFGRRGGGSTGLVAGLNCGRGAGDDADAVEHNRRLAADAVLAGAPLASVYQVHSPTCVTLDWPWDEEERPHADALVTRRAGIALGIVTADCAPVLIADREAGVIGAAHAGWRGAIGGVTDSTVAAMLALGARIENLVAAVGPCIGKASYEVDEGFMKTFVEDDGANERFFSDGPQGRPHFDLEAYVAARLSAAGVRYVEAMGLDTYAREDDFFSYRRATHRHEPTYGRQISIIALPR